MENIDTILAKLDSHLRERLLLYLALALPAYSTKTAQNVRAQLFEEELKNLENEAVYRRRVEEARRESEALEALDRYENQKKKTAEERFYLDIVLEQAKLMETISQKQIELMLSKLKDKTETLLSDFTMHINKLEAYIDILENKNKQQYRDIQNIIQHDLKLENIGEFKILIDEKTGKCLNIDMSMIENQIKLEMLENAKAEKSDLKVNTRYIVENHFRDKIKAYIASLLTSNKDAPNEDNLMRLNSENIQRVDANVNSQLINSDFYKKIESKLTTIKEDTEKIKHAKEYSEKLKNHVNKLSKAHDLMFKNDSNNTNQMGNNLNQIMVSDPNNPNSRTLMSQTAYQLQSTEKQLQEADNTLNEIDFSDFMNEVDNVINQEKNATLASSSEKTIATSREAIFSSTNPAETPTKEPEKAPGEEPEVPPPTRKFTA